LTVAGHVSKAVGLGDGAGEVCVDDDTSGGGACGFSDWTPTLEVGDELGVVGSSFSVSTWTAAVAIEEGRGSSVWTATPRGGRHQQTPILAIVCHSEL
jgi:hypothetical protein